MKAQNYMRIFSIFCSLVLILIICIGCKSKDERKPVSEPGKKIPLMVQGIGQDMYYVYDETGNKKIDFKKTNSAIGLTPGTYTIILNGVSKHVTIQKGEVPVVETGILSVIGSGQDLFYVFDSSGKKKYGFRKTNGKIEMFPGSYMIFLNNVGRAVTVQAGEEAVLDTGILTVKGPEKELYYVYDSTGRKRLDFRMTGREIELFPDDYIIMIDQNKATGEVRANEKTTVSLQNKTGV